MRWKPNVALALLLALLASSTQLDAQGKGKDKDKDKDKGRGDDSRGRGKGGDARTQRRVVQDVGGAVMLPRADRDARGKGRVGDDSDDSDRDSERGFRGRRDRVVFVEDLRPTLRPFFVTQRAPERVIVGAVSRAHLRGVDDDALVLRPVNDRLHLFNRSGVLLLDLDEDRARKVGKWDVIALDDRVKEGSPSFCRSGEGHPVFGREWCIEKGFGLGSSQDLRWGRTEIEDVVFVRPVTTNRLLADGLLKLLGPTAFDRLALHAITLGLLDPLSGMWLDDPSGPRVLMVNSGRYPVAEIVDRNRDDRPEVLLVTRRDW